MAWVGYKEYDHSFNFHSQCFGFECFISEVMDNLLVNQQPVVEKGSIKYYNIPASFDIETYSSIYKGRKFANMYIWQLGINGSTIYGRTWEEFTQCMELISKALSLSIENRLIIYVHNLSYEFQFIRKWLNWQKDKSGNDVVFSLKERRPIYALTSDGIEFRCSYILSNYALAYIGAKLLLTYPVEKKVGDLDYNIARNSKTVLTDTELGYCINDIRVVMSYIQEQIEYYGGIEKLPLTNTGRVRSFIHDYVTGSYCKTEYERKKVRNQYYDLMTYLQLTSSKEYQMLKSAFMGGFTHASAIYVGEVMKDMRCWDLASSYPAVMVSRYFPMTSATFVGQPTKEEFVELLKTKCCLFSLTLYGLHPHFDYEGYISESRCIYYSDDAVINNGRIMSAEKCVIICTELDFDIISKVYKADDFEVHSLYTYERGYLPKDLILAILQLYGNKTSLKDIEDKIVEYMVSKNMINASYGMIVTDIVRSEIIYYKDHWDENDPNAIRQLNKYNSALSRFLFYPWGVWVTAHARHNLWEAIFEFGEDYVYADTDSIKGIHGEKHEKFFEDYNRRQLHALCQMCMHYRIPLSKVQPKTKKGKEKTIGVWEEEEGYKQFKTLGAKRYCFVHNSGDFNMVVAGVNKSTAVPYLVSKFCGADLSLAQLAYTSDPNKEKEAKEALKTLVDQQINYRPALDAFQIDLEIPEEHCGKMTHTYVDTPMVAVITDYQGNTDICYEKSCTHLEPASYSFSIAKNFADFLEDGRHMIGY